MLGVPNSPIRVQRVRSIQDTNIRIPSNPIQTGPAPSMKVLYTVHRPPPPKRMALEKRSAMEQAPSSTRHFPTGDDTEYDDTEYLDVVTDFFSD